MIGLLSPAILRAVAVAAILAALAWGYHLWADHQREIGRQEIRAEWQADKLARAEANRILLMANAKATGALQAKADTDRKAFHAQIHSIDLERDELARKLRNRPERPKPANSGDGVPAVAGSGGSEPGCTGAQLYKTDGEFLVRESARADRLRIALQSCQAQYRRAQEAVNTK